MNAKEFVMRPSRIITMMFVAMIGLLFLASTGTAQSVAVVYNFNGTNSSQYPQIVTPAQGRDGKLYGTTEGGAGGSVFRIATSGSGGQLFALDGTDGSQPFGGVTLATNGNFYGTAEFGGSSGDGVLFQITASGTYTVLHDFTGSGDGVFPVGPPIEASDGSLYGATLYGPGTVGATVYKYDSSQGFSTIYTFDPQQGATLDGPLLQASDGDLYGTLQGDGANGCGGIFRLTTSGVLLNNYSFPCGKGPSSPNGPLVQASDGNFYGTTGIGGKKGYGTIFKMSRQGIVSVLYSFSGSPLDGRQPYIGLVQATDGNLYGSTGRGGTADCGTLYQITTAGVYTLLYSFVQSTGKFTGGAVQHTNGLIYGTAFEGGLHNLGSIFSLDLGLGSFITFVRPNGGIGQTAQILGQGLTGTTSVTFNGIAATSFTVVNDTYMTAVVPSGATTGKVVVTTPGGTLTSNVSFRVVQ
jgi:uncharacterized repeat protein (TIGR03803 family)